MLTAGAATHQNFVNPINPPFGPVTCLKQVFLHQAAGKESLIARQACDLPYSIILLLPPPKIGKFDYQLERLDTTLASKL
jgi:hypothetical protein